MANALSDFLGGFQAGDEITSRQREQRQTNQLARLAPQIVSGDPQAYAQAAAINPKVATQYQESGDEIAKRARGAAKYLQTALQSGNQQQIMAARQTIKPFMDTLKPGSSYPLDMDPTQESAGLQGFLAQTSYLDPEVKNGAPTGFREFQMKAAAAGLQPGTPEYQNAAKIALGQEGRASSSGFTQVKFTGPDGRERIGVMNGRTGQIDLPDGTSFNPQTGAMAATQGGAGMVLPQGGGQQVVEQDAALANQMIAAGIPSDQVDRFLQSRAAQFGGGAQPMPNAFVGRAPEEQAAATTAAQEQARQSTQMHYLPQELGMRTQAAIQQAAGTERAKGQVEQQLKAQQELPGVIRTSDQAISLIDQALNHPGRATATGLSGTLDPRNYTPGTDARDFQVLLDQIKGGTFLQAFQSLKGGGAITEVEGKKAEQAIARLNTAQSDKAFKEALEDLKAVANSAKENALLRVQQGVKRPTVPAAPGNSYSDLWK
ncbi:hypothetical protein OM948_08845 [Xanthomonas citri pv. fuscans]|uniref:hypothetical protein n=1 Tax=Xanthomonas citri TaxID=346 RepID=UPI00222674F9|nr:hypothetical protein [Xanthomonas citri]UZB05544.1 hypothetical protein OM948_08845 [Xanthomonas citri pv. fuscans]